MGLGLGGSRAGLPLVAPPPFPTIVTLWVGVRVVATAAVSSIEYLLTANPLPSCSAIVFLFPSSGHLPYLASSWAYLFSTLIGDLMFSLLREGRGRSPGCH